MTHHKRTRYGREEEAKKAEAARKAAAKSAAVEAATKAAAARSAHKAAVSRELSLKLKHGAGAPAAAAAAAAPGGAAAAAPEEAAPVAAARRASLAAKAALEAADVSAASAAASSGGNDGIGSDQFPPFLPLPDGFALQTERGLAKTVRHPEWKNTYRSQFCKTGRQVIKAVEELLKWDGKLTRDTVGGTIFKVTSPHTPV